MTFFGPDIRNGVAIGLASTASLGKPKPWTPAQIQKSVWLDAADTSTITLNGATVSQWSDKSGNGRNAVQATAASQPTYTANSLNGKTSLYFDGTDDGMSAAVPANTFPTVYEVYAVLQKQGAPTTFEAAPLNRTLASPQQLLSDGYNDQWIYGNGATFAGLTTNQNISNLTTASVFSYSLTPTTFTQYVNGTLTTNLSGTYFYGDTTQTTCWIATRGDGFTRFRGVIGEIVAVSTALSTADRQKLEGYLAWKWGGA